MGYEHLGELDVIDKWGCNRAKPSRTLACSGSARWKNDQLGLSLSSSSARKLFLRLELGSGKLGNHVSSRVLTRAGGREG